MLMLSFANGVMSPVPVCMTMVYQSHLPLPKIPQTNQPTNLAAPIKPITKLQNGWFRDQWATSQRVYA